MGKRTYHHGDLRNALVKTSVELIAEEGVHQLSLRKVARRAGVSSGAPYRHFPRREALLAAIAEVGFEKLIRRVERAGRRAAGSRRRLLEESAAAYVEFASQNPDYLRLMFGSEIQERHAYPALEDASRRSFGQLLEIIQRLRDVGYLDKRSDTETSALAVWSMLHGLSTLLIEGQLVHVQTRAKRYALTRRLVRTLLTGMG